MRTSESNAKANRSKIRREYRRLVVDLSVLHKKDAGTGIQRVVGNVWSELRLLERQSLEIVAVAAGPDNLFRYIPSDFFESRGSGEYSRIAGPYEPQAGDLFFGLDFSPVMLPRCYRTVKRWKNLGIPVCVVVYDLLPWSNPEWFTWRGARNFRRWLSFVRSHVDHAFCISAAVADELRKALPHRGLRRLYRQDRSIGIDLMRLGTDFQEFSGRATQPAVLAGLEGRPIILMVGTVEPRKGYDIALEIAEKTCSGEHGPVLVIVGKPGWKTGELQRRLTSHLLVGKSLFWISDADDAQLAWLYENSAVFLSTTRGEGFGLPLAEAMSYGLQVVAPDIPVFREFDGTGIAFYTAGQVDEASELLRSTLVPVSTPLKEGRQTVSWRDVAANLVNQVMLRDDRR